MNLIHSKLRNRLGVEKANKLIFIYMNQRVLNRNGDIFVGDLVEKSSEDQVLLKEAILDIIGDESTELDEETA